MSSNSAFNSPDHPHHIGDTTPNHHHSSPDTHEVNANHDRGGGDNGNANTTNNKGDADASGGSLNASTTGKRERSRPAALAEANKEGADEHHTHDNNSNHSKGNVLAGNTNGNDNDTEGPTSGSNSKYNSHTNRCSGSGVKNVGGGLTSPQLLIDPSTNTPLVGFKAHGANSRTRDDRAGHHQKASGGGANASSPQNTTTNTNNTSPRTPNGGGGGQSSTSGSVANGDDVGKSRDLEEGGGGRSDDEKNTTNNSKTNSRNKQHPRVFKGRSRHAGDAEDDDEAFEMEVDGDGNITGRKKKGEKASMIGLTDQYVVSWPSGFTFFMMAFACVLTVMGTAASQYFGDTYSFEYGSTIDTATNTVTGTAIRVVPATVHLYLYKSFVVGRDDNKKITSNAYCRQSGNYDGPIESGTDLVTGAKTTFVLPDGSSNVAAYCAANNIPLTEFFSEKSFSALGNCKQALGRLHAAFAFGILASITTFLGFSFSFIRVCNRSAASKFSVLVCCLTSLVFLTITVALSTNVYDSAFCPPPHIGGASSSSVDVSNRSLADRDFRVNYGLAVLYASLGLVFLSLVWALCTR